MRELKFESRDRYLAAYQEVVDHKYKPTLFSLRGHSAQARKFIHELRECSEGIQVFQKLYEFYVLLLRQHSIKLAKEIGLILAKTLKVASPKLVSYFEQRENSVTDWCDSRGLAFRVFRTEIQWNSVGIFAEVYAINDRSAAVFTYSRIRKDPVIAKYNEMTQGRVLPYSGISKSLT